MGRAKAAVLPVPVCAVPIKSLPSRIMGKARSWIGVGSVKPIAWVPRTTSGESPKLLNDTTQPNGSHKGRKGSQQRVSLRKARKQELPIDNGSFPSCVLAFLRDQWLAVCAYSSLPI